MNNLTQPLKKTAAFMIGGLLFATGWHADAQMAKDKGKDKDKKAPKTDKKKDARKKDGKKEQKKTKLEKKWPEKSSGSK